MAFLAKLKAFRSLQAVYMPGALRAIEREDEDRDPSAAPPNAEDIKLWLPSDLTGSDRVTGCTVGLPEMEVKLREAQCEDALTMVRTRLHAKRFLISFRNTHHVGQKQSTRSNRLIARMGDRVVAHAEKYRAARRALIQLKGAELSSFPELKATDLTLQEEIASDNAAAEKLGRVGSKNHRPLHMSTSRTTLSWIWTARGGPEEEEGDLHACEWVVLNDCRSADMRLFSCSRRMVEGEST